MLNNRKIQALELRWLAVAVVWLACSGFAMAQGTTDAAQQAAEQAAKMISQQATDAAKGADATRLNLTIGLATPGSQAPPVWNQPFKQIANIDWSTPVNPRLVNLGGDRFLFETRKGIVQWDFATLQSQRLTLPASASGTLTQLKSGYNTYAKLGGVESGTVFLASSSDKNRSALLWWSPGKLAIAASLPIPGQADWASVVQIATHHVLLCDKKAGASVVRLTHRAGKDILEWVDASDAAARTGLQAREVAGFVKGFGHLKRRSAGKLVQPTSPVFYDTAKCQWDLFNPPVELKPYFDKKTQRDIKPYFLADGRVLVAELSYHDGTYLKDIRSAYLWTPGTDLWRQLGATSGSGNQLHRVGQTEPVFATGFQSSVVEFFDTATLQWVRWVESLKVSQYQWVPKVQLEPLSSGKALVIVSDFEYQGTIGVMTPARSETPLGYLRTPVWIFGEGVLSGHRMLLVSSSPLGRVELIDMATGQALPLASMPAGPLLPVTPSIVQLPDASVLVYAGLPAGCDPNDYIFGSGPCVNRSGLPSIRYWPATGRMVSLPNLKIPFSWGADWHTSNSDLGRWWPRADVVVRPNGSLVWLEGGAFAERRDREAWPRASQLKAWSYSKPELPPQNLAGLRKARLQATLVNLADGRLAAIGGEAQLELVALGKNCFDCPDTFVSIGPFKPARSTEVLDETNSLQPRWTVGSLANFAGGKAFKLTNDRIFKLSLAGTGDSEGYRAEAADAAFTVWKDWPSATEKDDPLSVNQGPKTNEAFVRYRESFKTVAMPD